MPKLIPAAGRLEYRDRLPEKFCVHDAAVKDLVAGLTPAELKAERDRLSAAQGSWRQLAGLYLVNAEFKRRERAAAEV